MPRKCCVPNCRSNYRETEYVSVFGFPKDEKRRLLWLRNINRDFTPTKHTVVCIKHFEDRFISRYEKKIREDGTELCVKRKAPILSKDGFPTIFNDTPMERVRRKRRKNFDIRGEIDFQSVFRIPSNIKQISEEPVPVYISDQSEDNWMEDHFIDGHLQPPMATITGKRIVDFMYLFDQFQQIARHNLQKRCEFGSVYPITETQNGLCSEITLKCSNCNSYFTISLNDKSDGSDLNYSAVSGAEVTGLGHSGLKTLCDSIGMLSIDDNHYNKLKNDMEFYENGTGSNSVYLDKGSYKDINNTSNNKQGTISIKKDVFYNNSDSKPDKKLLLKTNEIDIIPITEQIVNKKRVRTKFTTVINNRRKVFKNPFNFVKNNYKEPYSEVGEVIIKRNNYQEIKQENDEIKIKEEYIEDESGLLLTT